jgi:hypothetical protein
MCPVVLRPPLFSSHTQALLTRINTLRLISHSAEFTTGLSKAVVVPDFPTTGRTVTLIWQESQQSFAIQSVSP